MTFTEKLTLLHSFILDGDLTVAAQLCDYLIKDVELLNDAVEELQKCL